MLYTLSEGVLMNGAGEEVVVYTDVAPSHCGTQERGTLFVLSWHLFLKKIHKDEYCITW
jgi:hypothetical protein